MTSSMKVRTKPEVGAHLNSFLKKRIPPSALNLMSDLLPAARLCGLPPVMLSNPRKLCESHRAEQLPVQLQRRTRRHRTIFTEEQLDALEELFLQNQYPDVNTREKLAQHTHLREERVEVRKSSVFV